MVTQTVALTGARLWFFEWDTPSWAGIDRPLRNRSDRSELVTTRSRRALRFEDVQDFKVLTVRRLRQKYHGFSLTVAGQAETWMSDSPSGQEVAELIDRRLRDRPSSDAAPVSGELAALGDLRDAGLLSEEEFAQAKRTLVGAAPNEQQRVLSLLPQLHALYKSGVLSESEFNTKKWDLLSKRG